MEVDTNTSEGDMGGIAEGNEATFTVDAYPRRTFRGKVSQIRRSPQTVQNVVTYDVVVGVDNSDLALMPGMTASIQIIVERKDDVVRVPNQALRYVPGGLSTAAVPTGPAESNAQARVWLLRDGKPVAIPIVAGLDDGTFTEIAHGELQPGDLVITGQSGGTGSVSAPTPPPRL